MSDAKIQEMTELALSAFEGAKDRQQLYDQKVQFLGKKGQLTALMKEMGKLSPEERPAYGQKVNQAKEKLESIYEELESKLARIELESKISAERLDMTLPAPTMQSGRRHPVSLVIDQIYQSMARLGYSVRTGPYIESDRYNFEALNIPADHPARDMQDTFFVDETHVLRTHTSPIQIHTMENEELPLRVVGVGSVFRCDSDVSHLPHFNQVEALCVDKKVSMADLRGTISFFVKDFFGSALKTRFRPSFFPFTEPSAEVDCQCPICKGKGCGLCGQSGWVEIGGCGLVNPKVFQYAGVPYPEWKGFAFGFGVERMAIIKYGINDIRLLPENDVRFLEQFDR